MPQTSTSSLAASLLLGSLLGVMGIMPACDSDAAASVGSPCDVDEDCDGALVCDIHESQGTCQEDHGHDTAQELGCAAETRADTFAVGLSKTGASITASFVSADPAPPILGDNTWVLSVLDSEGAPLEGLEIVVTPLMPDHGHGTPIEAEVTPTGAAGEYSVTPVNLFMAGYWEITFDVTWGDEQDSLVFGFCVE